MYLKKVEVIKTSKIVSIFVSGYYVHTAEKYPDTYGAMSSLISFFFL